MVFSRSVRIVLSGLAVTGGAVLGLGAAAVPASASAPQDLFPHSHSHSHARLSDRSLNANRHAQRTTVINRVNISNVSKNTNDTRSDQRLKSNEVASANAAAGGGGGGGGGNN